jgi:hypothetical protein
MKDLFMKRAIFICLAVLCTNTFASQSSINHHELQRLQNDPEFLIFQQHNPRPNSPLRGSYFFMLEDPEIQCFNTPQGIPVHNTQADPELPELRERAKIEDGALLQYRLRLFALYKKGLYTDQNLPEIAE